MKTVYIIGGTMGVGKTAVYQQLKQDLPNSVFLDGDWCWDANPFQVTTETKAMVHENIAFLLNQFIRCSAYENVIFCWVMHEQQIIDTILGSLEKDMCQIKVLSLVCEKSTLEARLRKDIDQGIRTQDILERSIPRLACYENLQTVKVNTTGKSIPEIAAEIRSL